MSETVAFFIAAVSLAIILGALRIGFLIGKSRGYESGYSECYNNTHDRCEELRREKDQKLKQIEELVSVQEKQMQVFKDQWFKKSRARKKKKWRSIDENQGDENE